MTGRPERLVLVTGTGTEVGKTWVACRLAVALRDRGVVVAARKPVVSYDPDDDPATSDPVLLARATSEPPDVVCPPHRWYPAAMAPPMAAEALGRPAFTIEDLAHEMVWPGGTNVGLVEAAGGLRSPMAADGDVVALAERLLPDHVVLVADVGLGVINAVRLAVPALEGYGWPVTVVANGYDARDDLHRRNLWWLVNRERLDVVITGEQLVPIVLGWEESLF